MTGTAGRARLRDAATAELGRRGWRLRFDAPLQAMYAAREDITRPAELRRLYRTACIVYAVLFIGFNLPILHWNELPLLVVLLLVAPAVFGVSLICFKPGRPAALREGWALGSASFVSMLCSVTPAFGPPAEALPGYFLASLPVAFVLVFLRLRFADAVAFTSASIAALTVSLLFRGDLGVAPRLYCWGFMVATAVPALAAVHRLERSARKVYLHTLLTELQVADMEEQNALLETLSNTDALTGVANRRRLDCALAERLEGAPAVDFLLLIDVDHFKAFNDMHGHLAGDDCLRAIARVVAGELAGGDLLARFGGEEFAVLVTQSCPESVLALAERLRVAVASARPFGLVRPESITISVGVAERTPGSDAALMIARADAALYAAKRAGRNCVRHAGEVWGA